MKNGIIKLFLTGTDSIDEAILKELNGATCKLVTENFRLGDKSITGALILEKTVDKPSSTLLSADTIKQEA